MSNGVSAKTVAERIIKRHKSGVEAEKVKSDLENLTSLKGAVVEWSNKNNSVHGKRTVRFRPGEGGKSEEGAVYIRDKSKWEWGFTKGEWASTKRAREQKAAVQFLKKQGILTGGLLKKIEKKGKITYGELKNALDVQEKAAQEAKEKAAQEAAKKAAQEAKQKAYTTSLQELQTGVEELQEAVNNISNLKTLQIAQDQLTTVQGLLKTATEAENALGKDGENSLGSINKQIEDFRTQINDEKTKIEQENKKFEDFSTKFDEAYSAFEAQLEKTQDLSSLETLETCLKSVHNVVNSFDQIKEQFPSDENKEKYNNIIQKQETANQKYTDKKNEITGKKIKKLTEKLKTLDEQLKEEKGDVNDLKNNLAKMKEVASALKIKYDVNIQDIDQKITDLGDKIAKKEKSIQQRTEDRKTAREFKRFAITKSKNLRKENDASEFDKVKFETLKNQVKEKQEAIAYILERYKEEDSQDGLWRVAQDATKLLNIFSQNIETTEAFYTQKQEITDALASLEKIVPTLNDKDGLDQAQTGLEVAQKGLASLKERAETALVSGAVKTEVTGLEGRLKAVEKTLQAKGGDIKNLVDYRKNIATLRKKINKNEDISKNLTQLINKLDALAARETDKDSALSKQITQLQGEVTQLQTEVTFAQTLKAYREKLEACEERFGESGDGNTVASSQKVLGTLKEDIGKIETLKKELEDFSQNNRGLPDNQEKPTLDARFETLKTNSTVLPLLQRYVVKLMEGDTITFNNQLQAKHLFAKNVLTKYRALLGEDKKNSTSRNDLSRLLKSIQFALGDEFKDQNKPQVQNSPSSENNVEEKTEDAKSRVQKGKELFGRKRPIDRKTQDLAPSPDTPPIKKIDGKDYYIYENIFQKKLNTSDQKEGIFPFLTKVAEDLKTIETMDDEQAKEHLQLT